MAWSRAGVVGGAGLVALALLSGGSRADPRTPAGPAGLPPPFLGVAVVGSGGRMEAADAYGDVVGLWAPGPAGRSLIYNPAARQAAGSVPADTGIVARMRVGDRSLPLWRADSVSQRYLPGTNALRTVARFRGRAKVVVRSLGGPAAARADRRWIARARPLGPAAPRWARAMYRRSLLVLRALTDRRTGAVAAGPREGWAYVWPRDASAAAIALAAAGYRAEARRIVRFLDGLDLDAAARFRGTGKPVPGRGPQGDAAGWLAAAARAVGLPPPHRSVAWRERPDYQEGDPGDYLGNALAAAAAAADGTRRLDGDGANTRRRMKDCGHPRTPRPSTCIVPTSKGPAEFGTGHGLVRRAGDPGSGLDSAAAWAVRPFRLRPLYPLAGRTMLQLAWHAGRYGIVPSESWDGGRDPWTAPTAWTAWALAALARGDRRLGALRGLSTAHSGRRRRFRGTASGNGPATSGDRGWLRGTALRGPRDRAVAERRRSDTVAHRERRAALGLMADLRRAATPAGLLPERVDALTGVPRSTTPLAWSHAFAILALRELWP
jgi:Glycosyl hydrolases family 15